MGFLLSKLNLLFDFLSTFLGMIHTVPTDRIVYRKICLELLKELFESLPKKDKHILGHSYGLFGYKQKGLDALSLEQMMTVDGIIKARKAALRKMKENYSYSKLRLWKKVYRTVMREAEKYTD